MAKVKRVRYFTKEKKALINPENKAKYERYLKSNIIKNREVASTTYKVYENYFTQFLVYLAEEWDNIDLYSKRFLEEAVDILEGFMGFCQDILHNNKKVINTKISAVSSFYIWSMRRGLIDRHPFDGKLERMQGASDEKIANSYFLTDEQIAQIEQGLVDDERFDMIDVLVWHIMIDSANRIGAISELKISDLNVDECMFTNVREKRGYRVEVSFSEETLELIQEWFEMRKDMDNLEVDAIFISRYKGKWRKMGTSTLQRRVQQIGTIIGIEDFHSHCIRKTALNNIYEKTGDLSLAAEMGNHKSTETTRSAYIKPMSKSEVRDRIKELMNAKSKG